MAIDAKTVLAKFTVDSISAKLTNNEIKINTDPVTTFRGLQKLLIDSKVQFHTHALPEEKSLKVLLHEIPSSYTEKMVKEELQSLGYEIIYIRQF